MKKFNFDKWMNIWLIIILGLHTLSLVGTLLALKVTGDMLNAQLAQYDPAGIVGAGSYSSPSMMLLMIAIHVISAVMMSGIAYLVLKQLSKE